MKPYYFLGASVLAIAVLVPLGAPMGTVIVGILVAALFSAVLTKPTLKRQK
jgi:hypothetical protein